MGILRTFIEKLETSGAVAPSDSDDPEPITPPLAAAEAAIQEAIRLRQAGGLPVAEDRRDPAVPDRRVEAVPAVPAERRGPVADRRSKGPAFGRRTRD